MKMDPHKYYAVTHRDHDLCCPMDPRRLARLRDLLMLEPRARVLDIACGKAEWLLMLLERYDVRACGVDASPYFLDEARERRQRRAPGARLDLVLSTAAEWAPADPEPWDCACCIGADWVFGGYRETLEALGRRTRPGGWIVSSAPHWRRPPPPEYLAARGLTEDAFGTHGENAVIGESLGLSLAYALVGDQDDWDHYHGLAWRAVDTFSREHPDDPNLEEIRSVSARDRELYLRWERNCFSWAIYAYRAPEAWPAS